MTIDPATIEGIGVPIRTAEWGDPRFSDPQRRAINAAAAKDHTAKLLGIDHNMRPVVAAKLGLPVRTRVYAIQRNGDPTEPKLDPQDVPLSDGTSILDVNADLGLLELWHPGRLT